MTVDDQGRPEPPLASNEAETLVGFLEFQRATFAWKCSGLDPAGLKASVGASAMTLGGMLKHLAFYEDHWFSHPMRGSDRQAVTAAAVGLAAAAASSGAHGLD